MVGIVGFWPHSAQAATTSTLNFQARLMTATGGIVPDGNYNIQFNLYNVLSGGTSLWNETYLVSSSQGVRVKNGYLTTNLGSVTSFPAINWDQDLYLGMTIRGTASCTFATTCTPADSEMTPRLKLTAVPYAFRAAQLAQFGGTYTSTLSLTAPTGGDQTFVVPDMAAAGTYTLLTTGSGVQLQSGSPGSGQTGNFNISGIGIAGSYLAQNYDVSSAGVLSIATGTAATGVTIGNGSSTGTITVGQSTANNIVNIGNAATATGNTQTINIGAGTPAGTGKATITIGNTNGASGIILNAGTTGISVNGDLTINNSKSLIVAAGTGTVTQTYNATGAGTASTINATNASGIQTNGLLFNRNAAGGTTTNGINITNSAGTLTTGLQLTGSMTNLINAASFTVTGSGDLTAAGTVRANTAFNINGTAGASTTCSGGQFLQNQIVAGGLVTGGSCAAAGAGGATSVAFSTTQNANGGSITSGVLTLAEAGGTNPGLISGNGQTFSGAKTFSALITGNAGATISGGTASINAGSNNATNINTGSSSGLVSIGGGSGTFALDTTTIDISSGGAVSGLTGLSQNSGAVSLTNSGFAATSSGSSIFKTSANSATAFQVQNANGTPLLGVGTAAPAANLVTNPGFEVNTTGWANKGTGSLTRITSPSSALYYGIGSGSLAMSAANDGAAYAMSLTLSATYNISFYARTSTGTATNINLGYTNGGGDVDCLTSRTVLSTGFTRFTCSVTISGTAGTAIYVKQNSAVAQTLYVDAFQVVSGSTATPYSLGNLQLRGIIDSPVIFQNANDSTTAFQIQNSIGTGNTLVADTLNGRVGIGTATPGATLDVAGGFNVSGVFLQTGSSGFTTSSGSNTLSGSTIAVGDATTDRLTLTAQLTGGSPIVLQGATDNAFTTTLALVDPTANNTITLPNASGTIAVSAAGNVALSAAGQISLTGQVPVGNGGTGVGSLTANGVLYGSGSSAVGVTAAGSTGQCLVATTGTAPAWGTCGTGNASTLQDVYNGSGTASNNPHIQLSNTNGGLKIRDGSTAVSGNLFQIQNSGGTATYFGAGTAGLTIQNSSAVTLLSFDTSTSKLRIAKTGTAFVDIYDDGTNAYVQQSTGTLTLGNNTLTGSINLDVGTAADAMNATKTATLSSGYSGSTFNITEALTGGANSISGTVLNVASNSTTTGSNSEVLLKLSRNNGTGGMLILAQQGGSDVFKVSDTGLVQVKAGGTYSALGNVTYTSAGTSTFTGSGAVSLLSGTGNAFTVTGDAASGITTTTGALNLTGAAASTWKTNAGALTLTSAAATTWSTTTGNLLLQAGGASTVQVRPGTNSAASFQVQNAGGSLNYITANTSSSLVQIGSTTTDTTALLLVLDYSSVEPVNVDGGMYYDTAAKRFKCSQDGFWTNCLGAWYTVIKPTDETRTSTTTFANDNALTFALDPSTNYVVRCEIFFNANSAGNFKYGTLASTLTSTNSMSNYVAPGPGGWNTRTDTAAISSQTVAESTPVTGAGYIAYDATLKNGATAGNWNFRWAQSSSSSNATTVREGSYCDYAVR